MKLIPVCLIGLIWFFPATAVYADEIIPTRKVPEFVLTDQNSKNFDSSQLNGSVWIADFIFTKCQGMCPLISGRMAELQRKFKDSQVKFISFSVDSDYDTPEVLKKYSERFGAIPGQWFFLTGSREKIWNLILNDFQLGIDRASDEDLRQGAELVMHSNRFVLVDQSGQIQGYFDSEEPTKLEELGARAKQLLQET